MSVPEICRRAEAKGYSISVTGVKFILSGTTKNPQIFTLEAIAIGMDIPPVAFIAEILGDRSEDPGFKGSQFGLLFEVFKEIPQSQRYKADPHVDGLLLQLRHIKAQSK